MAILLLTRSVYLELPGLFVVALGGISAAGHGSTSLIHFALSGPGCSGASALVSRYDHLEKKVMIYWDKYQWVSVFVRILVLLVAPGLARAGHAITA